MIWNGRAYSAKNIDNKPVEIQWNQQIVTADYLRRAQGHAEQGRGDGVHRLGDLCQENNAAPSKYIPYGPTNKLATADPTKVADLGRLQHQRQHRLLRRRLDRRERRDARGRLPGLEDQVDGERRGLTLADR